MKIFAIIITTLLVSSASHTIFAAIDKDFPAEERLRPLSLPHKMWKLDLGMEYIIRTPKFRNHYYLDPELINIEFPFCPLGTRTELHFILPTVKVFLLKNVSEVDSTIVLSGPNLALNAGIYGFGFSLFEDFSLTYGLGYQYKNLIHNSIWYFSNGDATINTQKQLYVYLTLGLGYQLT